MYRAQFGALALFMLAFATSQSNAQQSGNQLQGYPYSPPYVMPPMYGPPVRFVYIPVYLTPGPVQSGHSMTNLASNRIATVQFQPAQQPPQLPNSQPEVVQAPSPQPQTAIVSQPAAEPAVVVQPSDAKPTAEPREALPSSVCANGGSCCAAPSVTCTSSVCCGPKWLIRAEALWLQRSTNERVFLGEEQNAAGTVLNVLSTEDIDWNFRPGVRLTAARSIGESAGIELSYFGLHHWDEAAVLTNTNPATNSLFSNFLSLAGGIPDNFSFNYTSELHNAELNLHRSVRLMDGLTGSVLGGIRFVHLQEECSLSGSSAVFATFEQTTARTFNDLIGGQFGGELEAALGERLTISASGKAGLYMNYARNRLNNTFSSPAGASTLLDQANTSTGLAGSVEVGLMVNVRVLDNIRLRGGYQVMVISGLALAPEQFGSLNNDIAKFPQTITPGITGAFVEDRGSVFYHGPSAGVEFVW